MLESTNLMPSPVGHALAAVAAGWTIARPAETRAALVAQTVTLAAIGMAPDLDLLIGRHSRETHSLGAAVIVASIAALMHWPIAPDRRRIWLAACAAYLTHPVLDMLAPDHAPPIGVMFFWPFSREHFETGLEIFLPISRDWASPDLYANNLRAAVREVLILVPVVTLTWWVFSTGRSRVRSFGPDAPRPPSGGAADTRDTSGRRSPDGAPRGSPGTRRGR